MYKVLIVEDEMLVRLGLKNSIPWEKFDMTVIADVSHGQAALQVYYKDKPDLIITDLKMPVMSGLELISKIRENDKATRIIILTCLEEFEMARKAASLGVSEYILKLDMTQKSIETILNNVRNELINQKGSREYFVLNTTNRDTVKEKVLKNFMLYGMYSLEEFTRIITELNLNIVTDGLLVCVMQFDHYEKLMKRFNDENGHLIKSSIQNILNDIAGNHGRCEVFTEDNINYIFLLNVEEWLEKGNQKDNIVSFLENIRQAMNVYFNLSVSFGISSIQNGYENIHSMYQQGENVLKLKFFFGSGTFYHGRKLDIKQRIFDVSELLISASDSFEKSNTGFQLEYEKKIKGMFKDIRGTKAEIIVEFSHLVFWISNVLFFRSDKYIDIILNYNEFIQKAETIDDLVECIRGFFSYYRKVLRESYNKSDLVVKVLDYIKINYTLNITLKDISEHVCLSPNYISSIFNKEMQISIPEYINEIRIEKSKELLLGTYLKAYEIAEKIGFVENTYFTKIFKKNTGVSPKEFRKQWMKDWKKELDDEEI